MPPDIDHGQSSAKIRREIMALGERGHTAKLADGQAAIKTRWLHIKKYVIMPPNLIARHRYEARDIAQHGQISDEVCSDFASRMIFKYFLLLIFSTAEYSYLDAKYDPSPRLGVGFTGTVWHHGLSRRALIHFSKLALLNEHYSSYTANNAGARISHAEDARA